MVHPLTNATAGVCRHISAHTHNYLYRHIAYPHSGIVLLSATHTPVYICSITDIAVRSKSAYTHVKPVYKTEGSRDHFQNFENIQHHYHETKISTHSFENADPGTPPGQLVMFFVWIRTCEFTDFIVRDEFTLCVLIRTSACQP